MKWYECLPGNTLTSYVPLKGTPKVHTLSGSWTAAEVLEKAIWEWLLDMLSKEGYQQ